MAKLIARLKGGLGNQLFIYAAARALAERAGAELVLDTWSGFQRDVYQRQFSLQHFDIQYTEANAWQSFRFPAGRAVRKLLRYSSNKSTQSNSRMSVLSVSASSNQRYDYIVEKKCEKFDPAVKNYALHGTTWIDGFWQSPRYFDDVQDVIRRELRMKTPVSEASKKVAEQIAHCSAVGLHIRRLRNVLVGEENAKIKTLTLDFYHRSAERMARAVPEAHFFCFSDAPEWMEKNLRLPYPVTFVTHNKGDQMGHEDLWLMQQCRHFIISNSTFAWWAAWLGKAENNKVLTPGLRFWDCKDIMPDGWEIID